MLTEAQRDEVVKEYAPMLARIASSYENDKHLQQDLLQEISLAVWRACASFRGDASVKTFVAKVAHNRCVDYVIKASNQTDNVELSDGMLISQNSDNQEKSRDLMSAINRLSLPLRQVITMQLEGFTYSEIASVLGTSEAAVTKRAGRARALLEQLLGSNNNG